MYASTLDSLTPRSQLAAPPQICTLANGATLIADRTTVPAVSLNAWFRVGSVWEADAINGMAHFLEHMIFKGTARLPEGVFEQQVESRGGTLNAATSQEYTHFYLTTAPQDFAQLAPLQLDLVLNPTLAASALERERDVVLEEIRRADDNPNRRTYQQALDLCFPNLPYRRPVLGPTSVVEQLSRTQMQAFHQTWYRPETLTISVVGDLPIETLLTTVKDALDQAEQYSVAPRPAAQPEPLTAQTPEPGFQAIVRRDLTESRLQQARLVMLWRVPGLRARSETYALDVLAAILGQGRLSRLFQELREQRQLVYGVGVSNVTQQIQGAFYVSAQLASEHLATVEQVIQRHIRRMQDEPVTPEELARIRTQVANRFVFANERPGDRANLYGYYYSQLGSLTAAFDYPERIRAVTAAEVQSAAQRYLNPDAYGVLTVRPEG
ncbi:MAG: pitrilysin family protein [Cyanobacteria bacterium P01_G01_bin.54]